MTPRERLELYEKALIDYDLKAEQGNIFTSYGLSKLYTYGFCYYFSKKYDVSLENLPELYKPKFRYDEFYYNKHNKQPRIKALKNAIKTVKQLLS